MNRVSAISQPSKSQQSTPQNTQNNKKHQYNNFNNDEISDIDSNDLTNETQITESTQDTEISEKDELPDEFKEKVLTYLKIDDAIRKRQEEIKELREKKKPCEDFIIKFLEKAQSDHINVNGGELVKNEVERKGPLKIDIVREAISEGFKSDKTMKDEKSHEMLALILNLVEHKRPIQRTVNIKRTFAKKKPVRKPKTQK